MKSVVATKTEQDTAKYPRCRRVTEAGVRDTHRRTHSEKTTFKGNARRHNTEGRMINAIRTKRHTARTRR